MPTRAYELMIIVDADVDDAANRAVIERVKELVAADGGTVPNVDNWGRRRFAYPINHKNEGVYTVLEIVTDAPNVDEADRFLRLADDEVARSRRAGGNRAGPHVQHHLVTSTHTTKSGSCVPNQEDFRQALPASFCHSFVRLLREEVRHMAVRVRRCGRQPQIRISRHVPLYVTAERPGVLL